MTRSRALALVAAGLMLVAFASPASASTAFHPRVAGALGLVPPVQDWGNADVAAGAQTPVTYHGGQVMNQGVEIHTIFWDGGGSGAGGRDFQGSPSSFPPPLGAPTYIGMVEQFLTDVAADKGKTTNVFAVLPQFAAGTTPAGVTPGSYDVSYGTGPGGSSTDPKISISSDVIMDHSSYPAHSAQCASPQSAAICITDAQVQAEVDKVISATAGHRGLKDIWYVFTPPDVDECITPGVCESNAFGGYHSVSEVGHGTTIYAYTGDPIVETRRVNNLGNDPNGNPDAEATVDTVAHEVVEAMTDPEGVGYMDPNGFEVGDKCEFGPQYGQPSGFAANQSPYNQTINAHHYQIQEMWANHDNSGNPNCVQSTTTTTTDLPLPQINLTQFSGTVTGNTENATAGDQVTVKLLRVGADGTPVTVATGTGTTAADGSWSATLSGGHVVGDDRDQIVVSYTGTKAPATDTIKTGNGGNPFTESGWTGWTDLDNGINLAPDNGGTLQIGPCFQTGVESATLNGAAVTPPNGDSYLTDSCNTQTDVSTVKGVGSLGPGSVVRVTTNDDRAFVPPSKKNANVVGALVSLTVTAGEPGSTSGFMNPLQFFTPGGFPTCAGDLEARMVSCAGLMPGHRYTATDGSAHASGTADPTGTASLSLKIKGGDSVALSNGSRTVTTLHVAHLKASIAGNQSVLDTGSTCQPNQYFAGPLSTAPTNGSAGDSGVSLDPTSGAICPSNGDASGLSSSSIVQTDELSGGSTQTEVPAVQDTSPMNGEIVYGGFIAVASSGLPGPNNTVMPTDSTSKIGLTITRASGGRMLFRAANVDTTNGVNVPALKKGTYKAKWVLTDAAGDTRTVTTRFVEAVNPAPGGGSKLPKPSSVSCVRAGGHRIRCTVSYRKGSRVTGKVQIRIAKAKTVAGMGHANINGDHVVVSMKRLHALTSGNWTITVVLSSGGQSVTSTKVMHIS